MSRSKLFAEQAPAGYDPLRPPLVTPGLESGGPAIPISLRQSATAALV